MIPYSELEYSIEYRVDLPTIVTDFSLSFFFSFSNCSAFYLIPAFVGIFLCRFLGQDMTRVNLRPMLAGTLQRLAGDKRFICQTAAHVRARREKECRLHFVGPGYRDDTIVCLSYGPISFCARCIYSLKKSAEIDKPGLNIRQFEMVQNGVLYRNAYKQTLGGEGGLRFQKEFPVILIKRAPVHV